MNWNDMKRVRFAWKQGETMDDLFVRGLITCGFRLKKLMFEGEN